MKKKDVTLKESNGLLFIECNTRKSRQLIGENFSIKLNCTEIVKQVLRESNLTF